MPGACKQVSYDEMLELASLGAGVMHSRSIEFAKKFSVPIHVRSSFSDVPGTMIVTDSPRRRTRPVGGAALVKNEARVTILGVPDRPGTSLAIFSKIAAKTISVDMIVQNVGADGMADISFTVLATSCRPRSQAVEAAAEELSAEGVQHDDDVAKVSVVGLGMATQTGVARADVPRAGRRRREYPDDQHQRNQNLGAGQPAIRRPRPCGPCTRRSSLEKEPAGDRSATTGEPASRRLAGDVVAQLTAAGSWPARRAWKT